MTYVFFSPSEGFWNQIDGWLATPEDAQELNDHELRSGVTLPYSPCEDVKVVQKKLYSHESFEGIAGRLSEMALFSAVETLNDFVLEHSSIKEIFYLGDSIWNVDGRYLSDGELESRIKDDLAGLERSDLETLYNNFSGNLCYCDNDVGFFHQECL